MTLALLFHEYGLKTRLVFSSMREGPSSRKSPVSDEQPGPPLSLEVVSKKADDCYGQETYQSTTGSFLGSLRDSKNQ
jgi:hypothetical protein